jgi:D-3-phosphoglycerate dehydrogenase
VTVEVRGDLAALDTAILELAAVRGIFGDVIEETVTFVNAPTLAAENGLVLHRHSTEEIGDYRSVVQLHAAMPDGASRTVSGTLSGEHQVEKLVEINGRHFDLRAAGNLLVMAYPDRPGVMGSVGTLLGDANINIEAAQISQEIEGHASIMVLRLGSVPDADLQSELAAAARASALRVIPE